MHEKMMSLLDEHYEKMMRRYSELSETEKRLKWKRNRKLIRSKKETCREIMHELLELRCEFEDLGK